MVLASVPLPDVAPLPAGAHQRADAGRAGHRVEHRQHVGVGLERRQHLLAARAVGRRQARRIERGQLLGAGRRGLARQALQRHAGGRVGARHAAQAVGHHVAQVVARRREALRRRGAEAAERRRVVARDALAARVEQRQVVARRRVAARLGEAVPALRLGRRRPAGRGLPRPSSPGCPSRTRCSCARRGGTGAARRRRRAPRPGRWRASSPGCSGRRRCPAPRPSGTTRRPGVSSAITASPAAYIRPRLTCAGA